MEVPEIIEQLGLWDDVSGWRDDLVVSPSAATGATSNEGHSESVAAPELPESAGTLPCLSISTFANLFANGPTYSFIGLFGILFASGFKIRVLDWILH